MNQKSLYDYSISNIEQIIQNGGGTVEVFNNTLKEKVPFKNFAISIENDNAVIGYVEKDVNKGLKHKGAGIESYRILGEELGKRNITLTDSGVLLSDGKKIWDTLVKEKKAIKTSGGYSFISSKEDIPLNMIDKYSEWIPKRFSDGLTPHQSKDIMEVYKKHGGKVAQDALKQVYNTGAKNTHQGIDSSKQSSVNTKTSTIDNHKQTHSKVEENSIKNFFGANRLKAFDTETTGLNTTNINFSKRDRIWQVGLATEGIGGVEEHTNPFFTSKGDGTLIPASTMSKPYLESSLKHSNGKFSQTAFEQGNFNEFIGLYEKGGLSTLDDSIKNTLGTINSRDVIVLQNMNFENRMLKSSLEQGILSKDVYEDIASRMMTVDLNKDGTINTLLQRPAKVQEHMRKADMLYHTEYLNNMSEDSFQTYRQTVNNAIAEYSSIINNDKRVGAVAVELQDLSKAFLANAANRGLIDKKTSTLGLNIDFLSKAILGRSEKHTALQDSKDTIDLFEKMWSMNSELNSGAELSEKTKETLSKIKAQQPEEINRQYLKTVQSVLHDFKEKSYTKIGDKYSWYNPEVILSEKSENGYKNIVLDKISTSSKRETYSLPEALDKVNSRYSRYANNINNFDREDFTKRLVKDFEAGVDYNSLHSKVENFKIPDSSNSINNTQNILSNSLENKVKDSSSFWDNSTTLFGKEMKVKTKATILGGIGAGLAYMAFTPRPNPTQDRSDNVSTQFYDEQYLGTAFVDFKERNKHYMM